MVSEIGASQRSTETMKKTMGEEEEEYKCKTQPQLEQRGREIRHKSMKTKGALVRDDFQTAKQP